MATIRLLSVGSRGDLQPYLAILRELQRRGHAIQLIGSINFEAIATAHAVPFVPLPGDYRQLLASKQGLEAMLKTAAAAAQLANPTVLHLFSPQVLARPADWQESASVAGYCFLESPSAADEILACSYQPADELREFLDSGDRPFYAGFGSMIAPDPAALGSLVVEAARLEGQRLILSPGWGRIVPRTALPASVYVLEECPHSWLFPQLKGAIHHGGAGTTATTLRHGLPSTVVAFFADQLAWGRTLERLGVSPATHRLPTLSAESLALSMGAIANNPSFRIRARELQQLLGGEDGVANVVAAIEAKLIKDGVMTPDCSAR
jgi:sterol 3beta-glucosyltransferase